MSDEIDAHDDLVEGAKENLNANNRIEAVEKALFLACVIENADELLGIHDYQEQVETGMGVQCER